MCEHMDAQTWTHQHTSAELKILEAWKKGLGRVIKNLASGIFCVVESGGGYQ